MAKTEIVETLEGKRYKKTCKFCRKTFLTEVGRPQQVYCTEQHKELAAKRKKGKAKSHAKYTKKHNVERAIAGACRSLSRRIALLCLPPIDSLTGEEMSYDELQAHHLDGVPANTSLYNIVLLSAQSHAKVHQLLKEEFKVDIDSLYEFGLSYENHEESPLEVYESERELRDRIVKFQLNLLKFRSSVPRPVFQEK